MTEIRPEALIDGFNAAVEASRKLTTPGYDLNSKIVLDGEKIDFPLHSIDSIEPGEESGTFVMKLNQEIIKNRGLIMIITGASLLAIGGLIVQKRRKSS
jgi:hypothetical protein